MWMVWMKEKNIWLLSSIIAMFIWMDCVIKVWNWTQMTMIKTFSFLNWKSVMGNDIYQKLYWRIWNIVWKYGHLHNVMHLRFHSKESITVFNGEKNSIGAHKPFSTKGIIYSKMCLKLIFKIRNSAQVNITHYEAAHTRAQPGGAGEVSCPP